MKAIEEAQELLNYVNTEQVEDQEEVEVPKEKREVAANPQKKAAKYLNLQYIDEQTLFDLAWNCIYLLNILN